MRLPLSASTVPQRTRAVVRLCTSAMLVALLVLPTNASPLSSAASSLTVRAPSEVAVVSKRRDISNGSYKLHTTSLTTLGPITYTACSSPYDAPAATVCVAASIASIITALAGTFRAVTRRDEALLDLDLILLFSGNETHSPVDQMRSAFSPHEEHLVAYHADACPYTKSAVYFRHDPILSITGLRAEPQPAGFDPAAPSAAAAEDGGIYVEYQWRSGPVAEEQQVGNDRGSMDALAEGMLNGGGFDQQGVFCMSFRVDGKKADQGVLVVTQDSPYSWPQGQSETLIKKC